MDDKEKIRAAVTMLKQLKRMVGFFMKKEIADLIEKLEQPSPGSASKLSEDPRIQSS
jgi:hypothetical protein